MSVFPLHTFNNGTTLYPSASYYTEEYAKHMCSWYLTDYLYKDENGSIYTAYRLHSSEPRTFADYMAYDIICPKCGQRMQPIGNALNYHDLALYSCRNCNKK